jgi:hypothetical protein
VVRYGLLPSPLPPLYEVTHGSQWMLTA